MNDLEQQDLTGFLVLVIAALAVVVLVFLKMSGVIHRRGHRGEGRSPPPPPVG